MRATVRPSIGLLPTAGRAWHAAARGRDPDAAEQRSRGDAGGVLPAPQRAHRAEFGGAERDRHGDALAVAVTLGERQREAQPARGLPPGARPATAASSDAAQRAGEAHQQQRAVAQPGQVVADRRQDLAQHADLGGEFFRRELAALRGVAADAGERLADHRLAVGDRAAGKVVQVADRGAAQVDGGDLAGRAAARRRGRRRRRRPWPAGRAARGGRTRRTRRRRRRGRRGACCPPWRAARSRPPWRARWPACRHRRAVARSMVRSNQRRTWAGGAPSGVGTVTGGAGRGVGRPSGDAAGSAGLHAALSLTVMVALLTGSERAKRRQAARYCYARQADLSGIGRKGQGSSG